MSFVDLFYPRFCLGCGTVGVYLCLNCRKKLVYLEKDHCFYCQKPSLHGLTHPGCQKKDGVDGFISIFQYNNFLKKIIKSFKYRLAVLVWKEFSLSIQAEKLFKINFYRKIAEKETTFLQPIPLFPKKLRERGFNQAKIISNFFQPFLSLPIVDQLVRIKETKPQAQIGQKRKRLLNIRGAFKIRDKKNITEKSFIIVDDVLTSGKTAEEATKILKKAGAKKVFILTLAKG